MRSGEKLVIARAVIRSIAPEVRARGWHQPANAHRPSTWSYERNGLSLSLSENVLLLPEDPDVFSLLDVWPIGARKVFSVAWQPGKPWLPPNVSCCKQGDWLRRLGLDLSGT
jgi:hypothetical protein